MRKRLDIWVRENSSKSNTDKPEGSRRLTLVGDVVIRDESKNRNHWKLVIVTNLLKGRDGIARATKLKSGQETLKRASQHLYPLELACDVKPKSTLNPAAPEFEAKSRRDAAAAAAVRIQEIATEYEQWTLILIIYLHVVRLFRFFAQSKR